MSEYGYEKNLEEILQDLVTYCTNRTNSKVKIGLSLPKDVLDAYSLTYALKERYSDGLNSWPGDIKYIQFDGGTVEFL